MENTVRQEWNKVKMNVTKEDRKFTEVGELVPIYRSIFRS